MHVPNIDNGRPLGDAVEAGKGMDIDQTDAGLDEPLRRQQVLPQRMPAIAIAHPWRFLFEVEGTPGLGAGEQVESPAPGMFPSGRPLSPAPGYFAYAQGFPVIRGC